MDSCRFPCFQDHPGAQLAPGSVQRPTVDRWVLMRHGRHRKTMPGPWFVELDVLPDVLPPGSLARFLAANVSDAARGSQIVTVTWTATAVEETYRNLGPLLVKLRGPIENAHAVYGRELARSVFSQNFPHIPARTRPEDYWEKLALAWENKGVHSVEVAGPDAFGATWISVPNEPEEMAGAARIAREAGEAYMAAQASGRRPD